jgi:DNA-binding XRE family transcriptional regulator
MRGAARAVVPCNGRGNDSLACSTRRPTGRPGNGNPSRSVGVRYGSQAVKLPSTMFAKSIPISIDNLTCDCYNCSTLISSTPRGDAKRAIRAISRMALFAFQEVVRMLSNRLREVRENRKNWPQRRLAVHARVSPALISDIERFDYLPTEPTRAKLAAALEVDVREIWPALEAGGDAQPAGTRADEA